MASNTPVKLRVSALSKLPERFHELDGARRVDAILSLDDPESFVRSLAADELYVLIADIGVTDCTELIGLSSTEQRIGFIDIDCWRGQDFDAESFDEWLDIMASATIELVIDTVAATDPELIVTYLLQSVYTVFDRTEEDDYNAFQNAWELAWTPDHEFVLVLQQGCDEEMSARVRRLVDLLYRVDLAHARSIMFSVRIGLRTEQEEYAFRFRTSRLADLGFTLPDDAHALYAAIRLDAVAAELEEQPRPAILDGHTRLSHALVRAGDSASFLNGCLLRMEDKERFVHDFAMCVNRAIVCTPEGIQLRNAKRLRQISRRVHATISLGLEVIARGDLERGVDLLDRAWCMQLFQVGHSVTVDLARRARSLLASAAGLFDRKTERVLEGLGKQPQPCAWIEETDAFEAFVRRTQIESTGQLLTRAEALVDLFTEKLGFTLERLERHEFAGLTEDDRLFLDFATLTRTLLAHLAAGGAPSFEPVTAEQLLAARARRSELESLARQQASDLGTDPEPFLDAARMLHDALDLPDTEPLDPRFLGPILLVRRDP